MFFLLLLKLIRWKNLVMLIISQVLLKYFLFNKYSIQSNLNDLQFLLLSIATVFIASGGYIINDIFDIDCDHINKPDKIIVSKYISKKKAFFFYILFTCIGIISGIALSFSVHKEKHALFFILIALLLYYYSSFFQKKIIIGNFIISLLVASNLLVLVLFEIDNYFHLSQGLLYIYSLSLFIFLINLIREMVKDLEDTKGDYNSKMKTLPIVLGIKRTTKIIVILGAITLYLLIRFLVQVDTSVLWKKIIFSFIIILPFIVFMFRISNSKKKEQFHKLSTLLKIILGLGMIYILLITF
ncbi:geranylgeranylglycerol-phosphate geranylgeranyltransferase [Bacteroidota bacterium]